MKFWNAMLTINNFSSLKRIGLVGFLCAAGPAMADQFYLAVKIECRNDVSALEVRFEGAWNAAGAALVETAEKNGLTKTVDPRALISFVYDEKTGYTPKMMKEVFVCAKDDKTYKIEIAPLLAPNYHPEGFCATRIGADVKITQRGKVVASGGNDACTDTGQVLTGIVVGKNRRPSYRYSIVTVFYEQ